MTIGKYEIGPKDALLGIDLQTDFCPGGRLAVAGGNQIMNDINFLSLTFAARKASTILTQDWHPTEHKSFASTHGLPEFSEIDMPYGKQRLWPDHCVGGYAGSEFHPGIRGAEHRAALIIRKGMNPEIDSYSAFVENDQKTKTGLAGYLREVGIERLFLCGLAYDFCVGFSALDAVAAGFKTVMIRDLTRAIADTSALEMDNRLSNAGVEVASVNDFYPSKAELEQQGY